MAGVLASIVELFQRRLTHPDQFDLIYATGLYDYLLDRVAQKLTRTLFRRLEPGGSLLIANFLPDIHSDGYMEAFMDWWLIFRSEAELLHVVDVIPDTSTTDISTFVEKNQNIVFADLRRVS